MEISIHFHPFLSKLFDVRTELSRHAKCSECQRYQVCCSSCHILTSITKNGCRLSLLAAGILSLIFSYLYLHHQHHIVRSWCHHINSELKRDVVKWAICEAYLRAPNFLFEIIQMSPIWPCRQPIQRHIWKKNPPPHSIKAVVSICIDITIDRWCHQYYGIGTILVAPVSSCCLASSMSTINIIIMLMIIMMLMIILMLMPAWSWSW